MGRFDRQRATAKRLIDKNGQSVVWQQRVAGVGGTPQKPASSTVVPNTVTVVFLPPKRETYRAFLAMLTDTEIPTGGIVGLMWGGVPFTPGMKDTVLRGTEVLSIVDQNGIEVIDPNGEGPILYLLRFTR